jgi:hypothetical protein
MSDEAVTNKGGRIQIQTGFHRTAKGLVVTVKTAPEIEEYFNTISNGQKALVSTHGRLWQCVEEPLAAYVIPQGMGDLNALVNKKFYTLNSLGGQMLFNVHSPDDCVNLAFIRLVGASEGAGKEFRIRNAIFSLPGLKKIRDLCAEAQRDFYINYMRPVDLTVTISTQEV